MLHGVAAKVEHLEFLSDMFVPTRGIDCASNNATLSYIRESPGSAIARSTYFANGFFESQMQ